MSVVQEAAKALFKNIQIEAAPTGEISKKLPKHKKAKNPSFKKAKRLDANGTWEEAANHYYTIFTSPKNPKDKAEAFILLGQMYINLSKYSVAERFFKEKSGFVEKELAGWDRIFYKARVMEKLGWIYDYYGRPKEALVNFEAARKLLSERAFLSPAVLRVYETSNHFLGRQLTILAWQGENPDKNLKLAAQRFEESLSIYDRLEKTGAPDPAAKGFQYAWLARVHMMEGDLDKTEDDLEKMHDLFSKVTKENPGSGAMGYFYLLKGRLDLEKRKLQEARKAFKEAYRINTKVVRYVPSQADALFGLALCDWLEKKKDKALESAKRAVGLNPNLLKRGYI